MDNNININKTNFKLATLSLALTSILVGQQAQAVEIHAEENDANKSIKLGTGAVMGGNNGSVAIGNGATVESGGESIALGVRAKTTKTHGIAIGSDIVANGKQSTVIGNQSPTDPNNSAPNTTDGDFAVAIGSGKGDDQFAAEADGDYSIVMGTDAKSEDAAESGIAIGHNSNVSRVGAVAIGKDSNTKGKAENVTDATIGNFVYTGFKGEVKGKGDQVSFGAGENNINGVPNPIKYRQLKNVAAGAISEKSTDAINGSQLFSIAKTLGEKIKENEDQTLKNAGAIKQNNTNIIKNIGDIANLKTEVKKHASVEAKDNSVTVAPDGKNASGGDLYKVGVKVKPKSGMSVGPKGLQVDVDESTVKIVDGKLTATVKDTNTQSREVVEGTAGEVVVIPTGNKGDNDRKFTVSIAKKIKDQIKANENRSVKNAGDITNVQNEAKKHTSVKGLGAITAIKNGTNASGGDVYDVSLNVDDKTMNIDPGTGKLGVKTTTLTPNTDGKVNVGDPNSLATAGDIAKAINNAGFKVKTANGEGSQNALVKTGDTLEINEGKNIDIVQAGKKFTIKTKDNLTGLKSVTLDNGISLDDNGVNTGGKKITGIANGDVGPNSTDAVNGSQLDAMAKSSKENVTSNDKSVTIVESVNPTTKAKSFDLAVNIDKDTITKGTDGKLKAKVSREVVTGTAGEVIVTNNGTKDDRIFNISIDQSIKNKIEANRVEAKKHTIVKAGKNVNVVKMDDNGQITYQVSTKDDIDLNSVTTGGVSMSKTGINAGNMQVKGVARGTAPTDAVNVAQLNDMVIDFDNKLNDVADDASAGTASAMAMAGLPQAFIEGKSMAVGATSYYDGQGAVAVGLSKISDNGRWIIKTGVSADTGGEVGGTVGAGMHF